MRDDVILAKLENLSKKVKEIKTAVVRTQENTSRSYLDHLKYLVSGLSYVITDIGNDFMTMNVGKMVNDVVLEKPINARDIFVKLGEAQIIPGKAVAHIKRLLTLANTQTLDIKVVSEALPSVEVFVFYIKTFMSGVDLSDEATEELELIHKKELEKEQQKPPPYDPSSS